MNELKHAGNVLNMRKELWLVGVNLPEKNFPESQNQKPPIQSFSRWQSRLVPSVHVRPGQISSSSPHSVALNPPHHFLHLPDSQSSILPADTRDYPLWLSGEDSARKKVSLL